MSDTGFEITLDEAREILDGLVSRVPAYAWRVVKAELDNPRHEITCPSCGATVRARMADAPTAPPPV